MDEPNTQQADRKQFKQCYPSAKTTTFTMNQSDRTKIVLLQQKNDLLEQQKALIASELSNLRM